MTAYRALRPSRTSRTCAATSSATRTWASAVEAPRCGVSSVFGASSSGESVGGSCSKTSIAGPAELPDRQRLGDRGLVDDAAAGDVEHDRAGLHLRDRRAADQPARRPGQRDVDGQRHRSAQAARRTRRARRRGWPPARPSRTGRTPMTVISIARARTAMAWPILPSPTIPRVRPRSSSPVNWARFHSPRRTDASAGAVRRASP